MKAFVTGGTGGDRRVPRGADEGGVVNGPGTRVGAFFDVDETLLRVNSMAEFHWYFWRHRRCRTRGLAGVLERALHRAGAAARYLRLALSAVTDPSRVRVNRRYFAGLRGIELEEYEALSARWFREFAAASPFHDEVVARLRDHQARGHVVALVSGSHRALVRHVAAALGVGHVIATEVEVEQGRMSGRLVHPEPLVSAGKAAAMRAFAEVHDIDLSRSHAYSDHLSDLPMLDAVGRPCAVIGDRRLEQAAREQRWTVVDVRSR